jgi:hypothetical protein
MQTARKLIHKDSHITDMDNGEIIIAALYGRVDNKLGKIEALMAGFFDGVLKSLVERKPFFADRAHPLREISVAQSVIELNDLELELEKIINALEAADQSNAITTFLEAFDRLSVSTKTNVAHLIYGFLLAESWEKSEDTRLLIAELMLKIERLSPGFGMEVIPVLWKGGQADEEDNPIAEFAKFRSTQDQIDALNQFSYELEQLAAFLENGEAGNAAEEFNSLYTMLPGSAKETLLDVVAAVGQELVDADTLSALIELY